MSHALLIQVVDIQTNQLFLPQLYFTRFVIPPVCQSHYPGREIDYKIIGEENFLDNVEKLFHESAIDVMVVPNRKRNIFARLFNPSIAHKMLFHTDTPLIAIPS